MAKVKQDPCPKCGREVLLAPSDGGRGTGFLTTYFARCECGLVEEDFSDDGTKRSAVQGWNKWARNEALKSSKNIDTDKENNMQSVVEKFSTLELYTAEVKRLLLEKNLRSEWADELIDRDFDFLEKAFEKSALPVEAAFEVYITEEESAREPVPVDRRLKLDVSDQVNVYLKQLVKIGLWGDTVEAVAISLIQQQLASKLEAGLINATR